MDLFLTNMQLFPSGDVNWWTGAVCVIVMFLSALILTAPIHCRASKPDEETNLSTYLMAWEWAKSDVFCTLYQRIVNRS